MIEIVCAVRDCWHPLQRGERQWHCAAGHTFDVARSGYCNLLQPNERRSRNPGDTIEAARARRRLFERGVGRGFLDEIATLLEELGATGPFLDAGCGEGFHLSALCDRFEVEGIGIDISSPSIDLAARAHREQTWIVSNVDRRIPIADNSTGTILSITSRVNHSEFARILRAGGLLVVASPGPDDLIELRRRVLGEDVALSRPPDISPETDQAFELVRHVQEAEVIDADREMISDLLVSTYRGQRHSQGEVAASLHSLSITQSRKIDAYRRRVTLRTKKEDPTL